MPLRQKLLDHFNDVMSEHLASGLASNAHINLDDPSGHWRIAYDNDSAVAYLRFEPVLPDSLVIGEIYVLPEYRNVDVAKSVLLGPFLSKLAPGTKVYFTTWVDNQSIMAPFLKYYLSVKPLETIWGGIVPSEEPHR